MKEAANRDDLSNLGFGQPGLSHLQADRRRLHQRRVYGGQKTGAQSGKILIDHPVQYVAAADLFELFERHFDFANSVVRLGHFEGPQFWSETIPAIRSNMRGQSLTL